MGVKIENTALPAGKRGDLDWFKWELFVDEPPETLAGISNVEYHLHPTFPEPIRTADDEGDRFALRSSGWGEFDIGVTVHYKDGEREHTTYHLDLGKTAGEPQDTRRVEPAGA